MTRRSSTDHLVIHCSATSPKLDIGAKEIRAWHTAKGWLDIGYHYVIRRSGQVEFGRPENQVGSHVRNHNVNTLGICLVGGVDAHQRPQDNFTAAQWESLQTLLMRLVGKYPGATILGHRDFPSVAKACPCFDAIKWAGGLGLPAAARKRPVTGAMLRTIKTETENGDEADDLSAERTGVGKWLTAFGGLGSGSFGFGLFAGMDWMGIAVLMGAAIIIGIWAFIAMGYERRERLWDKLVGA